MLTSSVINDLIDAERDHIGRRLSSLAEVPVGVGVVVNVGALAPQPTAVRILARFEKCLHISIQGSPFIARRWHHAILEDSDERLW